MANDKQPEWSQEARQVFEMLAQRRANDSSDAEIKQPHAIDSLDAFEEEELRYRREEREHRWQEAEALLDLKKSYARWFFILLIFQLVVMNLVFVAHGFEWLTYSEYVLHLYMGGTLAEIFGVVFMITRSLFKDTKTVRKQPKGLPKPKKD